MADQQPMDSHTPPGDDSMWATHYVRDAIQELRQELRGLRVEMSEGFAAQRRESNARFYRIIWLVVALSGMQSALMLALFRM